MLEIAEVWPTPRSAVYCSGYGWEFRDPLHVRPHLHSEQEIRELPDMIDWVVAGEEPSATTMLCLLRDHVPLDIQEALTCVGCLSWWTCLRLIAAVPATAEIIRDIPILGALLADWAFEGDDTGERLQQLRQAVGRRRTELLGLLGIPRWPWVVNLLRHKLRIPNGLFRLLEALQGLAKLDSKALRWLQHVPTIEVEVLRGLVDPTLRPMFSFGFVDDLRTRADPYLLEHMEIIGALRKQGEVRRHPAAFRSWSSYWSYFEKHISDRIIVAGEIHEPFEVPFGATMLGPEPILAVKPITTLAALQAHGEQQRNCLGEAKAGYYSGEASIGTGAAYTVTWDQGDPEHTCSLWLIPRGAGWEVADCAGLENVRHPAVEQRLVRWVEEMSKCRSVR